MANIKIALSYKEWNVQTDNWPEKSHNFANEYVITVSRNDGVGITAIEAETVLKSFFLTKDEKI